MAYDSRHHTYDISETCDFKCLAMNDTSTPVLKRRSVIEIDAGCGPVGSVAPCRHCDGNHCAETHVCELDDSQDENIRSFRVRFLSMRQVGYTPYTECINTSIYDYN